MKLQPKTKIKALILLTAMAATAAFLISNSKNYSTVVNAANGADIYARSCARCHGSDGRAQTAKGKQTGATDFTSAKWQPNEARGIRTITNGKGKMPPFKGTLSTEEIKAVWAHVRGFK